MPYREGGGTTAQKTRTRPTITEGAYLYQNTERGRHKELKGGWIRATQEMEELKSQGVNFDDEKSGLNSDLYKKTTNNGVTNYS